MARRGEQARQTLMDAAEELFGHHGIDQISSRRIADHAGTANHSAVTYHFGSRDGLIEAVVNRHADQTAALREAMIIESAPSSDLTHHLRCLLLPHTRLLSQLPTPTWRARFLNQVRHTASGSAIMADSAIGRSTKDAVLEMIRIHLRHIDTSVLTGRILLLSGMTFEACAGYEQSIDNGDRDPDWEGVGHFLTDAAAGMLTAPATTPATAPTANKLLALQI